MSRSDISVQIDDVGKTLLQKVPLIHTKNKCSQWSQVSC